MKYLDHHWDHASVTTSDPKTGALANDIYQCKICGAIGHRPVGSTDEIETDRPCKRAS